MSVVNKPINTNNLDVTHEIYLLPLVYNKSGNLDKGMTLASVAFFTMMPLIEATSARSKLESRIQDLNPIGALHDARQDFGTHSTKWDIKGYVTDLQTSIITSEIPKKFKFGDVSQTNVDAWYENVQFLNIPVNRLRINMIKYCVYNSVPVILITNTTWDIITLDIFDLTESDNDAYTYSINLQGKSVLNRNSYTIKTLISDSIISTLLTSIDLIF